MGRFIDGRNETGLQSAWHSAWPVAGTQYMKDFTCIHILYSCPCPFLFPATCRPEDPTSHLPSPHILPKSQLCLSSVLEIKESLRLARDSPQLAQEAWPWKSNRKVTAPKVWGLHGPVITLHRCCCQWAARCACHLQATPVWHNQVKVSGLCDAQHQGLGKHCE